MHFVTETPRFNETLARQIAELNKKEQRRKEVMGKLRESVHNALDYDIPLTGYVLVDAVHYVKMLMGGTIPEVPLRREDRVFPEMPSKTLRDYIISSYMY